jgi:hypothetical protein
MARLRARFGSIAASSTPAPSTAILPAGTPKLPDPSPDASPWDLSPELFERWEERSCIMHFDGKLSWPEAETLALADILRQTPLSDESPKPASDGQKQEVSDTDSSSHGPYRDRR